MYKLNQIFIKKRIIKCVQIIVNRRIMSDLDKNLETLLKSHARRAYLPNVSNDETNETMIGSKFGGKPFINVNYPWPICTCNNKMTFFLQLNSSELPVNLEQNEKYGDGLLQFFYCTQGTECSDYSYKPFSSSQHIRIISLNELKDCQTNDKINDVEIFPLKRITGWSEKTDYITATELIETNIVDSDAYDKLNELNEKYCTISGDKLLGWPLWIQGVEYVKCRKCNKYAIMLRCT